VAVTALRGVDLDIGEGELVMVLGPSGVNRHRSLTPFGVQL
jgi:ABC-type nitrate/sulfonate/bicarbonate transport system ATPase subunit